MSRNWLKILKKLVVEKPMVIILFNENEWLHLRNSLRGINEFTMARSHSLLENVQTPTACVLFGESYENGKEAYFGLLKSRSPNTTLESRLKIKGAHRISPVSENELLDLVTDRRLNANLRKRLRSSDSIVRLSSKLSGCLVEGLAKVPGNSQSMRTTVSLLDAPQTYSGNVGFQEDAVTTALKLFFGQSGVSPAVSLETVSDRDTVLARVNILEDAVIEHDARHIPQFTLAESDLTGRAIFENGGERLEVITANKRPLEKVFGVDLIYLNVIRENVVMVQYKMLNPDRNDDDTDWIYRPDKQFEEEISRMKHFNKSHAPGPIEYRINPQVFYLKFVRRDAILGRSPIIIPIDHFDVLRNDPSCQGPKGAFRISFDTLEGRYLRQSPFLDLIRAGYIGAHAATTSDLTTIINAILEGDRAVVAAVQWSSS